MGLFDWLRPRGKRELETLDESTGALIGEPATEEAAVALLQEVRRSFVVTDKTAMEIPAFSSSVDFITSTVASLPIKLYRETIDADGTAKTEEVRNDRRVSLLNDETGDLLTAYDAKKALVRDELLYGAGYMYIHRTGNDVESLHYVKHGEVSVMLGVDPIYKRAELTVGGTAYQPWNFVILARNTENGVTGQGLVSEHKTLLSAAYEELTYEQILAGSGGNKKGFLQSETKLSDPALDAVKQAWRELYSSKESGVMVLNGGLKFEQASNTSMEMQLNQNKQTNAQQIASIFGLNVDVISSKAGADAVTAAVKVAVSPILHGLEAALNASLLLEVEKSSMYFAFDLSELDKADILQRYQAYEIGLRNNILQLDEVRYKEDLTPLGLNYVQLGLDSVLLDPDTGYIYTPNTNQLAKMPTATSEGLQSEPKSGIMEIRENNDQPHDPDNGQFTSKGGGGSSSGSDDGKGGESAAAEKGTKQDRITEYGKNLHFFGNPHTPPEQVDVESLSFNSEHINDERGHNVTEAEARSFIKNAHVSVTRESKFDSGEVWENYYSSEGAAYINKATNEIRTAFKAADYDPKTKKFVEGTKWIIEDDDKGEGKK